MSAKNWIHFETEDTSERVCDCVCVCVWEMAEAALKLKKKENYKTIWLLMTTAQQNWFENPERQLCFSVNPQQLETGTEFFFKIDD